MLHIILNPMTASPQSVSALGFARWQALGKTYREMTGNTLLLVARVSVSIYASLSLESILVQPSQHSRFNELLRPLVIV